MKKILLFIFTVVSSVSLTAQTATNFNCNDCNSVNHDLFTELDAGKVIVICWVMPCGSCIAPALVNSTSVQGFASSNPGRVKYYLCDDSGNTLCPTLTSWVNTNGIVTDANFSNSLISMYDYGVPGMPKTVVLGGPAHSVFYNVDGAVDPHNVTVAIQDALNATGISDQNTNSSALNLFPNPVNSGTSIFTYSLVENTNVQIELFNVFGACVKQMTIGNEVAGEHTVAMDFSTFSNGVYFIRLGAGESSQTIKFIVAK